MRMFAWALPMLLTSVSCGGSSSETPPPLEPDPTSFRYTGPRMPTPAKEEAAAAAVTEPEESAPIAAPAGKAAAGTWGSGKTPPTPAPAVTAPKQP